MLFFLPRKNNSHTHRKRFSIPVSNSSRFYLPLFSKTYEKQKQWPNLIHSRHQWFRQQFQNLFKSTPTQLHSLSMDAFPKQDPTFSAHRPLTRNYQVSSPHRPYPSFRSTDQNQPRFSTRVFGRTDFMLNA